MDLWFEPMAAPLLEACRGRARGILTEKLLVTVHSGGPAPVSQRGLSLPFAKGTSPLCVLDPRLRDEELASFRPLPDGRGVQVDSAAGTDYVFLGVEPFEYGDGEMAFRGTAGVIKVRGDGTHLVLHEGELLSFKGWELTRPAASMRF